MNKEELKPCPFCGEPFFIIGRERLIDVDEVEGFTFYYIFCQKCGARGPLEKTYEKAKDAWNKRSQNENSGI